ncbi:3-oxoacyl-ACP reductase [Chromobacterium phragmitis]|uniref:3-oxoacyl-ACP reductase FabG n=1 Tax=Chromobacterium phragmitis TaxID=2202141 RepID=A0ABV0J0A6_9NEIS|nr:3-oxoacyl-ACP reductase FabG [Chromobacterium phragmitis]AXE28502.1 3-oxoacyl-ACP reductase [Chromobacterium phragmitis]
MQDEIMQPWVLVTGGSRGIGKGLVLELAKDYRVVFTYKSNAEQARAVEEAVLRMGGEAYAVQCDGSDPEAAKRLATQCLERFGAPHAVINNAGVTRDGLMMSMPLASWRDVISANLDAVFHVTQAFLPAMCGEKRGAVLLMSSVTAVKGNMGQANYAATKAAMAGLARTLALETARFKIRVNAIAPGLIDTDMADGIPEKARQQLEKNIPLRRLGTVGEVAGLARYLLSDAAAYITGQTIVMDGGLSS